MKPILVGFLFLFSLSQCDKLFLSEDYIDPYHGNIEGGSYEPSYSHRSEGEVILKVDQVLMSDNKKYFVKLEKNGELVLYKKSDSDEKKNEVKWTSKSGGKQKDNYTLFLETEGSLQIRKNSKPIWSAYPQRMRFQPFEVKVTDYGMLCIFNGHYEDVWCNGE